MFFANMIGELHRQFQDFFIVDLKYKNLLMLLRRKTNILQPIITTVVGFMVYFVGKTFTLKPIDIMYVFMIIKVLLLVAFLYNATYLYRWYKTL